MSGDAAARGSERRSIDAVDLLKYIGSPVLIGTALLFYFGWSRSNAQAERFGVDVSVFEMSTDDLVLRSIGVVFFLMIGLLLVALVFLRADPWLREHARSASRILRFSWLLVFVGFALLGVNEAAGTILLPVFVLVAAAGTAYGARLRRHARGDDTPAPLVQTLLIGALLVVMLFWVTERIARADGNALAFDLQHNLGARSRASVFSEERLYIEGNGVTETALEGPNSKYSYRYDGLYLLQRSGTKYFLITDGWHDGLPAGRLVMLPDDETIRLEFPAPVVFP